MCNNSQIYKIMGKLKEGDVRIVTETNEKITIMFVGKVFAKVMFPDGKTSPCRISDILEKSKLIK